MEEFRTRKTENKKLRKANVHKQMKRIMDFLIGVTYIIDNRARM